MSIILHIETATDICSVVVSDENKIIFEKIETSGPSHAVLLGVFVDEAITYLRNRNLKPHAVAVSRGPGSYTGLRIGVSQAKGVCYGLHIPLIAIDTLEIMANGIIKRGLADSQTLLCPMIDARRMEVYDCIYTSELAQIRATTADIIDEESFADLLRDHKIIFFGNGANKCQQTIVSPNASFIENVYPLASNMVDLAHSAFIQSNFADTAYFQPFYLKDFVATTPKNKVLPNN